MRVRGLELLLELRHVEQRLLEFVELGVADFARLTLVLVFGMEYKTQLLCLMDATIQ